MDLLLHAPSDILRRVMVGLSLGTLPSDDLAWPIFSAQDVATPDNIIVVRDTSGVIDGRIQQTGEMVEYPGIQIRIRGVDQPTAYVKAQAICYNLDRSVNRYPITLDSTAYLVETVSRKGSVLHLGKEPSSKRDLYTVNATVIISRV